MARTSLAMSIEFLESPELGELQQPSTSSANGAWGVSKQEQKNPITARSLSPEEVDARRMSRALALQISSSEKKDLEQEHGSLVDRMFSSGLSAIEKRRLSYVRWRIERIHDAEQGDQLDALELLVATYENVAEEIEDFVQHADDVARRKKPRRKGVPPCQNG